MLSLLVENCASDGYRLTGFFGGPPSPIVAEFQSIVVDVWNQINSGYYNDKGSSYTGTGTSKSNVAAVSSDDNDNAPVLSLNSKSKAFPITVALIVINSILVVGILAAVFLYMRRTRDAKTVQYVAAGAHNAPKYASLLSVRGSLLTFHNYRGALEDIEHEMGPFDPKDSLPVLKKY